MTKTHTITIGFEADDETFNLLSTAMKRLVEQDCDVYYMQLYSHKTFEKGTENSRGPVSFTPTVQ